MEPFERLGGDHALQYTLQQLDEVGKSLPLVNDKLKLLEAALNQVAVGAIEQTDVPETSYGYIPIDVSEFFDCLFELEAALRADSDYADPDLAHRRVDFLEAGCGSGRNAFLAQVTDRFEFGRVGGFDIAEPLILWGRKIFGMGEQLFVADCNTYDYSPHDVVYFYRPFAESGAQEAFEEHLVTDLRHGAYIIGCGNLTLDDDRRLIRKDEHGRIYKKLR